MTKTKALIDFYKSFGVPAYPLNSADEKENLYITYEKLVSNVYGQQTTYPYLRIYMKTTSDAEIYAVADRISKAIGSGVTLKCDDGIIVVRFTSVWQPFDTNDATRKSLFTTLNVEFNTF